MSLRNFLLLLIIAGGAVVLAAWSPEPPPRPTVDPRLQSLDSVVYQLTPGSRLDVKTGKAGVLGFAGHNHVIEAKAFQGQVVYFPKNPTGSRLAITIPADSLQVLTPNDTAEIRKVTENMRTKVLNTAQYPEITLVSRAVTPTAQGFHLQAALTLAGVTRELPIDVTAHVGVDTLDAASTFAIKQSDFGIKPIKAGPGGAVKVADKVTFNIKAVAVRTAAGRQVSIRALKDMFR
jgi:polyisoprenoid-binding protein YceI